MSGFSRAISAAEGVFAPGHLGELTRVVPFELVDAVLEEAGAVQRRLRKLPSRVGVYFVLALALFPNLGYARVWGKLVAGLSGLNLPTTSEKALRDLRRRVGAAPLQGLFEVFAGPVAQPGTPGVRYRRFRTVAFDGCSSIRVPDTEQNRNRFGRARYRQAFAGYPMVMLMTLVETGTRALVGAVFGTPAVGEVAYALRLVERLCPDMLVLADRGFDADAFLSRIAGTGAQLLVRIRHHRRPAVLAQLPDGSFLSTLAGIKIRSIDADVVVSLAGGRQVHLPGTTQGHDRRGRDPARDRPRPGLLHHRAGGRPRPGQGHMAPPTSQRQQTRPLALERHLADTTKANAPTGKPRNQRKEQVLAILAAHPDRHWHARELGQLLNVPDPHSFTVQMSQWARQGILRRTSRGIYALPLTPAKNP
jgi:hypothetical protein